MQLIYPRDPSLSVSIGGFLQFSYHAVRIEKSVRGVAILWQLVVAETRGMRQCMCVASGEWLRQTFDPALRTSKPPYKDLRTELGALSESGVLSDEEASRARGRLDEDERDRHMLVRRRSERGGPYVNGVRGGDRLEGELTPEHPLGEVGGIAVVVMLVQLWTSRLTLRLEALPNQLTDTLDATYDTGWKAYERRWVEQRAAAEAEDLNPPEQPSVPLLSGLPLSVADDVGTRYHAIGTATGGSEHPWRSEWRLEPGVPASASVLRIALEDGELERECLELVLPSRRQVR
jgi:hypothetical protein